MFSHKIKVLLIIFTLCSMISIETGFRTRIFVQAENSVDNGDIEKVRIVDRDALKKKIDENEDFVLFDARTLKSYEKEHIIGAISLPVNEAEVRVGTIIPDKNKEIIVYCSSKYCPESSLLVEILVDLGYTNVAHYEGGIDDWKEVGYPTEKNERARLPVDAQQDYTIISNEIDSTVVFDGKWTTDEEWKNGTPISMRFNPTAQNVGLINNGTVYCQIKRDGEELFVLIDAVSSPDPSGNYTSGWDFYGVCIDSNNEKSEYPMKDDLIISLTWLLQNGSYWVMNGFGRVTEPGWDAANARKDPVYLKHSISSSPLSEKPHVVCELAIPLEDMGDEIGFGVVAINFSNKTINTWPDNFVDGSPKTWGTVIINKTTEIIETPISIQTTKPAQNQTAPPPTEEIDKNGSMNIWESLSSQTIFILIIGVILVVAIIFIARKLLKRKK
ncbi:MAG: rhodanese-like domain-containing protein [Candidatus Bathyarchaeota archaeon]|nr:rhodanese-like domain-containing protein [Candidatus Bathyarchaeota archaeon]